ncbi:TonB-dependent receptor [Sphingobium sp. V4]|uniref:TonB-dependent receptor n=1 Tax=Sphingobium sp. V4 TaxID=3038927 RepID=UPI002557EC60|nr:TonB-dependent receptor [Sphingobium sp. V4]WIW89533.1 TonB-dependent receptor [Sphingobium sp. V4]
MKLSTICITLAGTCLSTTAWAQSTGGDGQAVDTGVEDIVVTAQRREERLQDVPVAVTALSAGALEKKGILATADLGQAVPGLLLAKSNVSVTPFMRGIGNSNVSPGSDPAISTYVDGVLQQVPTGLIFGLNNIERIEVLKGPQGTLFGRNATGGAIQIITRDPTNHPRADFSVSYANFDTLRTTGYIAGGAGIVAADVAVLYSRQTEGWGRNYFTPDQAGSVLVNGRPVATAPVPSDVGTAKEFAIRSKIIVRPDDNLTIKLVGNYSYVNSDQGFYLDHLYGDKALITQPGITEPYTKTTGFYDVNQNFQSVVRSRQLSFSAEVAYETNFATLRSISAYTDSKNNSRFQSAAQPMVEPTPQNAVSSVPNESFTQELQLLSKAGSPFDWIVGAYYLNWKTGYLPLLFVRGNEIDYGVQRQAPIRAISYSVYGQGTVNLGAKTRITAGLRYNFDESIASQVFTGQSLTTLPSPAAVNVYGVQSNVVPEQRAHFRSPSYRIAIDHHFNDDVMIYASFNRGYKSGTYNGGSLCTATVVGLCPAANIAPPVEPEILKAYEAGFKSDLFDRKLRLNASGFYYDYSNLQVQTITGTPPVSLLQNAAQARMYGVDVDFEARPIPFLTLSGGFEWLHAEYGDFINASTSTPRTTSPYGGATLIIPNAKGNRLIRAPKFTGNIAANLSVPAGPGTVRANISYYHNSGFFWEVANRLRQESYGILNGDIGYDFENGVSFRLWGRNLGSTKYYSYVTASSYGDRAAPAAPRTFGITLQWSYK